MLGVAGKRMWRGFMKFRSFTHRIKYYFWLSVYLFFGFIFSLVILFRIVSEFNKPLISKEKIGLFLFGLFMWMLLIWILGK